MLKNIALFLVAPFIGLAYIILLPIVGPVMLAFYGGCALSDKFHKWEIKRDLKALVVRN